VKVTLNEGFARTLRQAAGEGRAVNTESLQLLHPGSIPCFHATLLAAVFSRASLFPLVFVEA